jgi:SAM-dependent methyltransferase
VPSDKKKRMLIGIPGYAGVVPRCQKNIMSMAFWLGRCTDLDVAIEIVVKKEQFRARNFLVNAALATGCDYLLMLDDDMLVPHDLPIKLMAHNKKVVGALYYQRGGVYRPVAMTQVGPDEYGESHFNFWSHNDPRILDYPGLHPADVIGGGCMLFDTEVFERVPKPYFEWEKDVGTDIAICSKLRHLGYDVWLDTSIELGHVGDQEVITSRSIPIDRRMLQEEGEILGKDLERYYGMPTEWIIEQMQMATTKAMRRQNWGDLGQNWHDVQIYYQSHADWHVFNLAGFTIWTQDAYRGWMLNEGERLLNGGTLLDYGPGVGSVCIPLARQNRVYAFEVARAATLPFLRFRQSQLPTPKNLSIWETYTPFPACPLPEKVDGACMISVLNHLTHPLETVKWVRDQLKVGGYFVCDWALHSDHDGGNEPQHLDAYDIGAFGSYMKSLGFVVSPEHPWLFFYQPTEV